MIESAVFYAKNALRELVHEVLGSEPLQQFLNSLVTVEVPTGQGLWSFSGYLMDYGLRHVVLSSKDKGETYVFTRSHIACVRLYESTDSRTERT